MPSPVGPHDFDRNAIILQAMKRDLGDRQAISPTRIRARHLGGVVR